MFNDLMIDIETLSTSYNAVITQIGACYFDRETGEIGKEFSANIQIQDCLNKGLEVRGDTIKFWLLQEGRTFLNNPETLNQVLAKLRYFYDGKAKVWAHATFDFPILANAYKVVGEGFPLPYRNLRDIRTLTDLAKVEHKKNGEEGPKNHNALDDCRYQVKYCVEYFNALNQTKLNQTKSNQIPPEAL